MDELDEMMEDVKKEQEEKHQMEFVNLEKEEKRLEDDMKKATQRLMKRLTPPDGKQDGEETKNDNALN